MLARRPVKDVTESVAIDDARAVAAAVERVLDRHFAGRYDASVLRRAFADTQRLFAGEYPGHLACDMPYHDLRHSLDTALATARLLDGYQATHAGGAALSGDHALLGVVLALFHDSGLIRKDSEGALIGPLLMPGHEVRSVELAESWLGAHAPAGYAPLALLIDATKLLADLGELFAGRPGPIVALGQILGTADLLSQLADRCYLERCRDHLYLELTLAAQGRTADERPLYTDGHELLRQTPAFYEAVVVPRLERDFARSYRHLEAHFGGRNPYLAAVEKNIGHLRRVLAEGRFDLLRRRPQSTTRDLALGFRRHG